MDEIREHITDAMRKKLIGNEQLKLGKFPAARETYIEGLRGVFSAVERLKYVIQARESELKDNIKLAHDLDAVKFEIEEIRVQLISNLSLAEVKMELWSDAQSHANMVLVADPTNMKALFRRSIARIHLKEQVEDALCDLQKLSQRDPKNKDILSAISEGRNVLKEERKTDSAFRSSMRGSMKREAPRYDIARWLSSLGDWFGGHLNGCSGIRNYSK